MPPKQYKRKGAPKKRRGVRGLRKMVGKLVEKKMEKSVEKKLVYNELYDQSVGQVNINSAGYLSFLTTPTPAQGTSQNQRIGNRIMLTGFHYNCMLIEQSTKTQRTAKFYWAIVNDRNNVNNVYTTGNASNPVQAMYNSNAFIRTSGGTDASIRAYGSPRNVNTMARFQILRSGGFTIPGDVVQAGSTFPISNRNKSWSFGKKFKKPLEIAFNSSGETVKNELFFVIFCDSGNISSSTNSTLTGGVPDTSSESGWTFSMNETYYYTDA